MQEGSKVGLLFRQFGRNDIGQSPAKPRRPDANSIHGLSLGESPGAIQYLGAGPIEAHRINPALQDGQAVGSLAVAAAELDGYRTVRRLSNENSVPYGLDLESIVGRLCGSLSRVDEIAEAPEVPIGTVMSRLFRGKERLKALPASAIAENQPKVFLLPREERVSK